MKYAFRCAVLALSAVAACGPGTRGQPPPGEVPTNIGGGAKPEPIVDVEATRAVDVGERKVAIQLDMEALRGHAVGKRSGPLIAAAPRWRDTLRTVAVEPVRDLDWLVLSGASHTETTRDAILLRYAAADAPSDAMFEQMSRRAPSGGAFDLGMPKVRGVSAQLDAASRVLFRPEAGVLAVVPSAIAKDAARVLSRSRTKPTRQPSEGLRAWIVRPHEVRSEVPECIAEARAWVVLRPDGGAEVLAEGECPDPASAEGAADSLRRTVARAAGSFLVRLATGGVLSGADIKAEGRTVKARLPADRNQLEIMMNLVAAQMNVDLGRP